MFEINNESGHRVAREAVSPAVTDHAMWVDGEPVIPPHPRWIDVVNPVTERVGSRIVDASEADVDLAVRAAVRAASGAWRSDAALRRSCLHRLGELVETHATELAELDILDTGRLQHQAIAQVAGTARWYRHFADLAGKVHGETLPAESPSMFTFTLREPLGVIGCITAWNAPLLLAALKVAPALAAGNAVVVKPSEFSSASTVALGRLASEAGMPDGVLNVVTGLGSVAGKALVANPGVDHVSFTGSVAAGAQIASDAGRHLKGVTLELGGKSPNIVFADADLDAATAGVLGAIFTGTGHSCIAGSRVLVQRTVYDEVLRRLADRARTLVVGEPWDAEAEVGAVANQPQLAKIERCSREAVEDGARAVVGGERMDRPGFYFPPTIFAEVSNDSRLAREEVFGPVMAVIPFEDDDDALRIANDSEFGLAAGVWTRDVSRAHRFARELQAGTVYINTYRGLSPQVPFGGYKSSGIGRENGLDALLDFTQVKSVWLETQPSVRDLLARG